MKYPWFLVGFATTVAAYAGVNVIDYFRERAAYHKFLEDTGWTWAGAWNWGVPFPMMIEGVGLEGELHSVLAPGAVLNLILCLSIAGLVGVGAEYLRSKLRPEKL